MSSIAAVFAAVIVGALSLFTPKAKAGRLELRCGEIRYLGHGAEWWHFQYVAARHGWRKANAHGQRHPERYREHGCGRLIFRGHGPERWHRKLVLLSERAREAHRRRALRRQASSRPMRAARLALRYVGVPYVWGGASPGGFDCSGLVYYAYRLVGIYLPRTTWAQMDVGRYVSRSQLRVGDAVFFNGGSHEGLYLGGGRIVTAPHPGARVHVVPLAWGGSYYTARRFG